ncbi:MAG: exodeoxyribonuclease V subunit alpha [Syntrophales bacterium]
MSVLQSQATDPAYSSISRHFADFVMRLHGVHSPDLHLAAFLVTEAIINGHTCLNLHAVENQVFHPDGRTPVSSPDAVAWGTTLKRSPVVGKPGEFKPLILDEANRLYTYRYWNYERIVAERLVELATRRQAFLVDISMEACRDLINRIFPEPFDQEGYPQRQVIAALIILIHDFCLISGSPGTGKTTAVARILAFILEICGTTGSKAVLAAPTAKAAIRLQDAIVRAKAILPCSNNIKNQIPEDASTIHRLLGSNAAGTRFAFSAGNPLPYDIVIVDEASMIDLPMMSHLLEAISPSARLILLGDPHQLSSVEAGAVLDDICQTENPDRFSENFIDVVQKYAGGRALPAVSHHASPLPDCMVELKTNYRMDDAGALGQLKRSVISGKAESFFDLLASETDAIQWLQLREPDELRQVVNQRIGKYLDQYVKMVNEGADASDIFSFFETFRVLCAVHGGLFGTTHLNHLMEMYVKNVSGQYRTGRKNYPGKAVMITRNDYGRQLFNGDLGIMLSHQGDENQFSVFFLESGGRIRRVSPFTLPEHETAFAMTVHKSQGSEYDDVFLFLPDSDLPVLSRELLYTGITRTKRFLTICARKEVLSATLSRKLNRYSGLAEKMWKQTAE